MPKTFTDQQGPRKGRMNPQWLILNGKGMFHRRKAFGREKRNRSRYRPNSED